MISLVPRREPSIGPTLNGFAGPATDPPRGTHEACYELSIRKSIEYMVRHQDQPLLVAHLASIANISLSHYFAVFKQFTGFTPMDFFIRLRMRKACEFLDSTGLSIKEVATALGYDDQFYFSRVFKTVAGVAPTDYRRQAEVIRQAIREAALPLHNGCVRMLQACRSDQVRSGRTEVMFP